MKHINDIIFFVITDLHLGLFNKTEKLVYNLINYFNKNKKAIAKADVLVLDGDTFDKLLSSNSMEYKLSIKFIAYLVRFCKDNNIKLRVLEGTPSHDNKQMEAITEIISREYGMSSIDYKYISTIEVEYMKDYDKHILYVPDKMADSGEEIQELVSTVLSSKGLSKVDLIFMHGNFNYQLPIKLKSGLSELFFLDICRYYIVIGHIHLRSIFKRIIAPGSFDRLEVNNEGPKGGVFLYIGKTIDESSFKFLDNLDAMRYDTLILLNLSSKEVYRKVKNHIDINNLSQYDHIRLKVDTIELYIEVEKRLIADGYNLTIKRFDEATKKKMLKENTTTVVTVESFEINEKNIYKLLTARPNISSMDSSDLNRIQELLYLDKL